MWSVFISGKKTKNGILNRNHKESFTFKCDVWKLRFYGFSFFDLPTFWKLFSSTVSPNRALSRGTVFSRWELLPTRDLTCPKPSLRVPYFAWCAPILSWFRIMFFCMLCFLWFLTIAVNAVKESVLSQEWDLLTKNRMFYANWLMFSSFPCSPCFPWFPN